MFKNRKNSVQKEQDKSTVVAHEEDYSFDNCKTQQIHETIYNYCDDEENDLETEKYNNLESETIQNKSIKTNKAFMEVKYAHFGHFYCRDVDDNINARSYLAELSNFSALASFNNKYGKVINYSDISTISTIFDYNNINPFVEIVVVVMEYLLRLKLLKERYTCLL